MHPESKQAVLDALIGEKELWRGMTLAQGEERLRKLTVQRGLDWDKISEDERENFTRRTSALASTYKTDC